MFHLRLPVTRISSIVLILTLLLAMTGSLLSVKPALAANFIITPGNMQNWSFFEETADGTGALVQGPGTPLLGAGSASLYVNSTGGMAVGVPYPATLFNTLTTLSYSTYRVTGGSALAAALQFNVDYNLTDTDVSWQGRLVFEPYLTGAAMQANTWQTWDALTGAGWFATRAPGTAYCSMASPCTLAGFLSHYPNAGIHATLGAVLFKAGGGWTGGFLGSVDNFTINADTYDFEPGPIPSVVYVDDDWASVMMYEDPDGTGPATHIGVDAFSTIQGGVDGVLDGGTVNVAAGTYRENVVIDKPLTLAGSGQTSTIVQPAISNPNCGGSGGGSLCAGSSNVLLVQANNITIHDLQVDGDNPTLTSTYDVGGANLDARNGIITNHGAGNFNGLEVYNVTVKNIYLRGIYASTLGTFNFHHNTVDNVQADDASIAIFAWFGPGIMANNTVSNANDAISANHSRGIQFLNNIVTNSSSGVHTDNAGDGGGVADVIRGNTVQDCKPDGYGVWVFVPYLAPTVEDNIVSNCQTGLSAWGQGAAVIPQFLNNSVTGPASAEGSVGAYITTDIIGWGYRDITVHFEGNHISNFETGVYLTADEQEWNPDPYEEHTITATFLGNAIENNTTGLDMGTNGTYMPDFSANWWGTSDAAAVKTAANGGVLADYTPWLASGTDTVGFHGGFLGDFSVLYVDDDSPQTGGIDRIQEGVNLIADGALTGGARTVNVMAGTYTGSIDINAKSLSIHGEDAGTTVFQPTVSVCWNVGGYGCSRRAAVRVVSSTNVTISDLTLDFNVVKANNVTGVLYWDSTGTLTNNTLMNMSIPDASGGYNEITSYLRAPGYTDEARATVMVNYNTFIDAGRVALLTHDFVNTTVDHNTFYKTTADFGYAMEIGSESEATISNNVIYGYNTAAASDGSQSGGIYIENAFTNGGPHITKDVTVANNEVYNSQWGMTVGNEYDGLAGDVDIVLTASGNNFHGNSSGGVQVSDEDRSDGSSITATFESNTLTGNAGKGYSFVTAGDGALTISVENDTVSGNNQGISVRDTGTSPSGSAYNISIQSSAITSNTVAVEVSGPVASATIKGNTIANNETVFSMPSGTLVAYANNITHFTDAGLAAAAGTFNAAHNWWGSYDDQPTGVDDDSWAFRLGNDIHDWAEGVNSASLGGAAMTGGTGTAVIITHGRPTLVTEAPFGNDMGGNYDQMCSDFYDFFAVGDSGEWSITIPVDDNPLCNNVMRTKAAFRVQDITECSPSGNKACWDRIDPTSITAGTRSLVFGALDFKELLGTPFVAGSIRYEIYMPFTIR